MRLRVTYMAESTHVADSTEDSSPNTVAVNQTRADRPWLFSPGHDPRRNVLGRIPKKPTVWDETRKLASSPRHRKRIAQAAVETMEEAHSVAGTRERALFHDRDIGKVVQGYVIVEGDSPLFALFQQFNAIDSGETVDGEARELPPGE